MGKTTVVDGRPPEPEAPQGAPSVDHLADPMAEDRGFKDRMKSGRPAEKKSEAHQETTLEGSGHADIITAASAGLQAPDGNSLTQRFLAAMETADGSDPESVRQTWNTVTDDMRATSRYEPQTAELKGTEDGESCGNQIALVIGNSDYTNLPKLKNAASDAQGMQGHYASRGYDVTMQLNAESNDIRGRIAELKGRAQKGDHVDLYYAGHGVEQGLAGIEAVENNGTVDGIVPNALLGEVAKNALSKGYRATIIDDSCHSGQLIDDTLAKPGENG